MGNYLGDDIGDSGTGVAFDDYGWSNERHFRFLLLDCGGTVVFYKIGLFLARLCYNSNV